MKKVFILILFASCTRSIILDGSKSYDPDGTIVWQKWEQISGAKAIIEDPMKLKTKVILFSKGTYEFKLTVKDNEGAITSKSKTINE